jgi:hypothetical protein
LSTGESEATSSVREDTRDDNSEGDTTERILEEAKPAAVQPAQDKATPSIFQDTPDTADNGQVHSAGATPVGSPASETNVSEADLDDLFGAAPKCLDAIYGHLRKSTKSRFPTSSNYRMNNYLKS